jgi:hypothetical protein
VNPAGQAYDDGPADAAAIAAELTEIRARDPHAIARAARNRRHRDSPLNPSGRTFIVAADHPARGSLAIGGRRMAMADRADLLARLRVALAHPGVTGVLAAADVVEDLLLLGALDDKTVFGTMNRGGLAGSSFEIDDRFTAYDADGIAASGLDGGKMLLRIDVGDPATADTLEACARAVSELAARRRLAMVEPFMSTRVDGRVRNDLSPDAVIHAMSVAAGLGTTSAYTWLKVPAVADMARVVAATTLPTLVLGGELDDDSGAVYERWQAALRMPTVRGLVAGRALLYPPDGDVAGLVDRLARLC